MTSIEITHTMRAVVFDRYGDPCVLREARVPMPTLRPGGVLIRVRAIGVNPADGKWRSGMFAGVRPLRLPHVGGYDIAGEVVSADADWLAPGMRVVAMLDALTRALMPTMPWRIVRRWRRSRTDCRSSGRRLCRRRG